MLETNAIQHWSISSLLIQAFLSEKTTKKKFTHDALPLRQKVSQLSGIPCSFINLRDIFHCHCHHKRAPDSHPAPLHLSTSNPIPVVPVPSIYIALRAHWRLTKPYGRGIILLPPVTADTHALAIRLEAAGRYPCA